MFRSTLRTLPGSSIAQSLPRAGPARRLLSTAPPHQKSRTWKSSAARWALAGGLVYYYNTSNTFAEEPAYAIHAPPETDHESETLPTLDAISEQRRAQARSRTPSPSSQIATVSAQDAEAAAPGSPGDLEEEASQEGAFNEETGEINWECPCLGGMAHGPCGEQFKAAFSCFVFSKEEPKGVDCIEHFKTMQNCFREHPDTYGAELDDEETEAQLAAEVDGEAAPMRPEAGLDAQRTSPAPSPAPAPETGAGSTPSLAHVDSPHSKGEKVAETKPHSESDPEPAVAAKRERAQAATEQVRNDHDVVSESDKAVPKAWHDGTTSATGK